MAVISSKNFIHSVTKQLALFIADSKVKVGERLPAERILVKELKVSRSSIREALKYWETLKVVEKRIGSGTYLLTEISPNDKHVSMSIRARPEDMLKTLEVRRCLETTASIYTTQRATEEEIDFIEDKLVRMEEVHHRDGQASVEDWEFHKAIYQASHNPMFYQIIEGMLDAFYSFFAFARVEKFATRSFEMHRELFESIEKRDVNNVSKITNAILDIVEEDIKRIITKNNGK